MRRINRIVISFIAINLVCVHLAMGCISDFSSEIGAATLAYEDNLVSCGSDRRCKREAGAIYDAAWRDAINRLDACM